MVLPTHDYPPVPTHTLSNTQIQSLQRTQNKALSWATEQRYIYTHATRQIHELTDTETINILVRLHKQDCKIWETLHQQENETCKLLKEKSVSINTYHKHFPSSLEKSQTFPVSSFT